MPIRYWKDRAVLNSPVLSTTMLWIFGGNYSVFFRWASARSSYADYESHRGNLLNHWLCICWMLSTFGLSCKLTGTPIKIQHTRIDSFHYLKREISSVSKPWHLSNDLAASLLFYGTLAYLSNVWLFTMYWTWISWSAFNLYIPASSGVLASICRAWILGMTSPNIM